MKSRTYQAQSVIFGLLEALPRRRMLLRHSSKLVCVGVLTVVTVYLIVNSFKANNSDPHRNAWWRKHPIFLEDAREHVNPHRFPYLSEPPAPCSPDVQLLVAVSSAVDHSDRRAAIRRSWGEAERLRKSNARLVFILGRGDPQDKQEKDLLRVDFVDSYRNLTLKSVSLLKWSSVFCPDVDFVMKTDDDIFVNVPLLTRALEEEKDDFADVTGCIKNGAGAPQPIPQINLPNMPRPPSHPAFVAGAGYVLRGGRLIESLYRASLDLRLFPVEDVFVTAHCARRVEGAHPPKHDTRFSCGQMVLPASADPCGGLENAFTAHKVTPERQGEILAALEAKKCRKQKQF